MLEWNFENTYYLAVIISALIALIIYFFLIKRKRGK